MEKVTGIGGVFFRAQDQATLGLWHTIRLGIDPTPTDHDTPC